MRCVTLCFVGSGPLDRADLLGGSEFREGGGHPGSRCSRRAAIRLLLPAVLAHELEPRHVTTATEVRCECGHETTVFPSSVLPWANEVPDRIENDTNVAIADEDGLFTCAGCDRSVYVPSISMN